MEVARCILLLLQLFLHLLSTYTNLLHLSLYQSFTCFGQLVPSISSLVGPVYIFYPLHVPLPSSKYLLQVVSKHDHTTLHHSRLPAHLVLPSIPTFHQLPCITLVHQLYITLHHLSDLLKIATIFARLLTTPDYKLHPTVFFQKKKQ